jgi:hypothetical protein
MSSNPHAAEPLFALQGRVEARRVLRPAADGPRLEVSFSATLEPGPLGAGGGAFSFVAQPLADGRLRWRGRGLLLLAEGSVSATSEGWGQRSEGRIRYHGTLQLRSHAPALDRLAARPLAFEYEQDLQTLAVRLVALEHATT